MTDRPIQFSQEQIFHGASELLSSGLLKPGVDVATVMIAIARAYTTMRRMEAPDVKPKELFILGQGRK